MNHREILCESWTVRELDQDSAKLRALIVQGCIQKFADWPPGARTANGKVLCD
jgi:hypothetical protein